MGWVDQVGDISFKPTAISRTLKESESLQAGVKHTYLSLPVYDKLPKYFADYDYKSPVEVRDGPFQYAHGIKETTFDHWAKDPIATLGSLVPNSGELINGSSGKDVDVLLADVGDGKGHDLNKFITTFPDTKERYVLEDLPVVIDDTYDRNPRIEAVKHDLFQEQPIPGARIYFMHHVLHDWADNHVVRIFSQIAKVMKPGYSRLLLGENVLQDTDCHLYPVLREYNGAAFRYDENGRTMENVT